MKASYVLAVLTVVGILSISAVYAQESQIKLVDWIPHTIYTDRETTLPTKIFDARYNPTGDPESNNPTIEGVNVAIVIFNENYELQYDFQGVTKYGVFQPKFILPENFRNGKYIVEIIAWNHDDFDFKSKIMFIDDPQIPSGGNQDE